MSVPSHMPATHTSLVLTKRFAGQDILASPRAFNTKLEAAEEALSITGGGVLETTDDILTIHRYLGEDVIFRLAPAENFTRLGF